MTAEICPWDAINAYQAAKQEGDKPMIDRTQRKPEGSQKPQDGMKSTPAEARGSLPFTLYGSGGRAWVEQNWSARGFKFSNQTRRP